MASGTEDGTKPSSPFSSFTSSSIVFRPDERSFMYSSSLPGIEASATVTCTPRTSAGGGRRVTVETAAGVAVFVGFVELFDAEALGVSAERVPSYSWAPPATTAPDASNVPTRTARRRRLRRRVCARRSRNREFGSSGSKSIDTGAGTLVPIASNRNSYHPPMVLSDRTIRRLIEEKRIGIDPYDPGLMQPSSLDVRVDRWFRVFRNSRYPFIDVKQAQEELTELVEVEDEREAFILHPGEFVLGSTLERVTLPDDLVARLEGKSSLGRLGLLIHSTAGFIDPGWDGHVTLELSNVATLPITIYPGMKIGQLSFVQLSEPAEAPYGSGGLGSKYQGQQGPTPSRYYRNFEDEA